ncbi:MAG: C45 family autoproteolytic acyltransferase/hydrolase, partial [Thermoguttaceae bacterium]
MNPLAPLRHAFHRRVIGNRVPEKIRRRYRSLCEAPVEATPDGGARLDRARLWRRGGLRILRVVGDRFEMAFQHGRLLVDEVARASLRQASLITANAIRNSYGDGLVSWLLRYYADRCLSEPILRNGLAYLGGSRGLNLGEIFGLAEGGRVPVWTLLRAAAGPETAQVLLGLAKGRVGTGHLDCSSFAAWGAATRDGEMIVGRNTDYPLNGCYDALPTAVYFEPTDGAHRYLTVTSAGFHIAGVCGMNEHGLFVGVHSVPASSVSERGMPVFLVGQEILRRARTIDEAAALLDEVRPAAGWNYHIVSASERRAITFEVCQAAGARRVCDGDVHITTNHWTQP